MAFKRKEAVFDIQNEAVLNLDEVKASLAAQDPRRQEAIEDRMKRKKKKKKTSSRYK